MRGRTSYQLISVAILFLFLSEVYGCFGGHGGPHDYHIQTFSSSDGAFPGSSRSEKKRGDGKSSDGYANDDDFDIFGEVRIRKQEERKTNKESEVSEHNGEQDLMSADSLLLATRVLPPNIPESDDNSLEGAESKHTANRHGAHGQANKEGKHDTQFWHLKSLQDIEERQRSTQCIWNGHTCMTDEHCCSLFCKQDFKGTRTCTMPVIDPYQVHESDGNSDNKPNES